VSGCAENGQMLRAFHKSSVVNMFSFALISITRLLSVNVLEDSPGSSALFLHLVRKPFILLSVFDKP